MSTAALYAIFVAFFLISLVSAERFLYYRNEPTPPVRTEPRHDKRLRRALQAWHLIRYRRHARRLVWLIRALVGVCPLLGLLGTVAGMVTVFDALAVADGGAARLASASVLLADAILPTLAGMTATVPGLVCLWLIQRRIAIGEHRLCARLTTTRVTPRATP